jgi:anti-sigma regulatory factor (Ser/Thr protein kinase)
VALVELLLSPLPSHVRTARLVVVAAARRAGLDDELVDELRLALGEACSRAVGLHARHAPGTPVQVTVADDRGGLTVRVTDQGPAAGPAPGDLSEGLFEDSATEPATGPVDDALLDTLVDPDVALAVVTGLVDDVEVEHGPGGTTVSMRWPLPPGTVPGRPAGPGGTSVSA